MMKDNMDYKTLLDFSNGKYSYNDYQRVKNWFVNVRDDEQTEARLFNQWQESATDLGADSLQSVFEKIHYQILLEERNQKKKLNLWHYYRQIAAVLIPIFFVSTIAYFSLRTVQPETAQWVEINAPEGARVQFMLPDSSTGWLNSGARLKYPSVFASHRQVELSGEAFFKVKHLDHSDFTVSVADLDVKVLGTQFNVSAYSDEANTEVVLKEGKVEIEGKTGKFSQILRPGEKINYNHETKSLEIEKVDPSTYLAWKDGYLVIDNEPLEQAVRKIERWYNAEISIQNETLKNLRLKATFADEPLEEVLSLIAMTTPVQYEISKRDTDENNKIKKKHVTMMLKQ